MSEDGVVVWEYAAAPGLEMLGRVEVGTVLTVRAAEYRTVDEQIGRNPVGIIRVGDKASRQLVRRIEERIQSRVGLML